MLIVNQIEKIFWSHLRVFWAGIIPTIVLLCTSYSLLFAQRIIPSFETLNVNQGLTQSSVYAIHQDRFGYMWIGTADGLNRYDGNGLKQFKIQNDKLEIESNFVRGNLAEDADGNIWYCNESGIYCFEQCTQSIRVIRVFQKDEFKASTFMCLGLQQGCFWMSNATNGVFSYSLKTGVLKQYHHKVFNQNSDIYYFNSSIHTDGKIWIAYSDKRGLWSFDIKTHSFQQYDAKHPYTNIKFGIKKHYLLSENEIYIYDSVSHKTIRDTIWKAAQNFSPTIIIEDFQNRLWAASSTQGLAYYDPKYKKTWHLRHHNAKLKSLPNDLITCCLIDRADNLWIGTDGGGVCFVDLKQPKFNLFPQDEGEYPKLKNFFTKCFYEDSKKRIWVGSHDAGLSIIEPYTLQVKNISRINGNDLCAVGAIFEDKERQIWVGHSKGFAIFNEQKNTFKEIEISKRIPLKSSTLFTNDLKQLPSGVLMAATQWGLVLVKETNGIYRAIDFYKQKNFGAQALSISLASNGDIWVASPTSGLLKIKQDGDSLVLIASYFTGVNVRSVHIDDADEKIIWVATAKGLLRFDSETRKFRIFNQKDGMVNSFVYGILSDEKNNLWMSTNGGLVYYDRIKNRFANYSINDGLQSNEFNTGAFYKSKSGTFYFGGINGFNWFRPKSDKVVGNSYKPQVALTTIYINDQYFVQDKKFVGLSKISLPYFRNKLNFEFSVLDYTSPKANKICYQLKGWDNDWICGYDKNVVYQNLSPGNYELLFKGINGNEQQSDIHHVLISIHLPFWKTWWFLSLIILCFIGIVFFSVRIYTRNAINKKIRLFEKQKAIAEERNRISRDMHDEIGSGLTHIALISELIQTQKKTETELRKDVGNIANSAQKLVASMSEIIWALNPNNDTLESLLSYLREQTRAYFEPFDIHYHIDFPDDIPQVTLSNEKRRNLFLVAKEALNNALKYAQAQKISLIITIAQKTLTFEVVDDGMGLDIRKVRRGANGLINMQKRMNDIGGTFELRSSNMGTSILFTYPLP